jgi:hypothetical protein
MLNFEFVIPAKSGNPFIRSRGGQKWSPAFAGMTIKKAGAQTGIQ